MQRRIESPHRLLFVTAVALAACTTSASTTDTTSPAAATSNAPHAGAPTAAEFQQVAQGLAQSAMVKTGDRVLIFGSVRDAALLEDIAIEAMKRGGQPLITIGSDRLNRRSYEEVPASYDTLAPAIGLALANAADVMISVDVGESDSVLAGVPPARIAARTKAGQPVIAATLKRNIRSVNLGNLLYPTATLASRLGVPQNELATIFWRAAAVPPETIRAKGDVVRAALSAGKQITVTAPNGTSVSFTINPANAMVSDGALTAEKVKQGGAAAATWLPAGELLVPVTIGSAEGKVVVDKLSYPGAEIAGLTLTFSKGKLTGMTATSGLESLKALYDPAGGGKDVLSFIDLGLNPEVKLPTNTGRLVWMAAGGVTLGMGDNRGWGGTNASDFTIALPLASATVSIDGKPIVENGTLK